MCMYGRAQKLWDPVYEYGMGPLHVLYIHTHKTKLAHHKALFSLGPDTIVSPVPARELLIYAVAVKQFCADEL